jgi:dihydroorotate dehydrogenase electron transfer subunit
MPKRIESLQVIENKHLTHDIFTLELISATPLPEMKPGQFVQVKIEGSPETFLRRPLSVHNVNYEKKTIKLLIQVAGKGTRKLYELKSGDSLNIIYPLGNSFTVPQKGQKILLAGGGCGVAPLLFLGKYLKNEGFIPDILLGFRNKERIIEYNEYTDIGKVYLTTEDGSEGEKGYITDHPVLSTQKYDIIYCCGPEPMMKAIAKHCKRNNTYCEVSLENLMGCGIGACLCCVVDTVKGNLCTCIDGPVFNINLLKW